MLWLIALSTKKALLRPDRFAHTAKQRLLGMTTYLLSPGYCLEQGAGIAKRRYQLFIHL